MPVCKNDKTRNYKGDEPSPKGLGYCAHAEDNLAIKKGKNKKLWRIVRDKNERQRWKEESKNEIFFKTNYIERNLIDYVPYHPPLEKTIDTIKLKNSSELMIKNTTIKILFDYPFNNPQIIKFESKNGFTRRKLFNIISKKYQSIYDEEEQTKPKKQSSGFIKGMLNRVTTTGKWGIWGHGIEDLDLILMRRRKKEKFYRLAVSS